MSYYKVRKDPAIRYIGQNFFDFFLKGSCYNLKPIRNIGSKSRKKIPVPKKCLCLITVPCNLTGFSDFLDILNPENFLANFLEFFTY